MKTVSRVTLLTALGALLAILAASCGGSSSTTTTTESASQWADGVCSALVTWRDSVQAAVKPLSGGNVSKDSLSTAGDGMKNATSTLVDSLKSLGPPDTASGQKAKDELDNLATEFSSDADTIKSALNDASGAAGLASAASTISSTLQKMGSQAQSTFSTLQSLDAKGELKSAFQNSPTCKKVSGSSS